MSDIALPIDRVPELPRVERLLSDERLARLAGRGSARAFTALYERHHQALYRYCRSIVRNDHDAQDALQSAMMRAYAALREQERDLAVRPWLFRIAHNEAISILRRRGPEEELRDDHERLDGGVERTLEVRERLSTLVADLRALPERQRAALLMRELSGLSIAEIAGALSISPGAAKQTLFEARGSLHELSEGRAMRCEAVRQAISQRDGRVLRGRRIGAHLRACEECRAFRTAIGVRGADLRALAPPLPAFAASAMLTRLLAPGGSGHAGGAAAAGSGGAAGAGSGAALGGHAAGSLLAKGLAGLAVLAAATAGTVHLTAGQHGRRGKGAREHSAAAASAGAAAGRGSAIETGARAASPRRPGSPGSPASGPRRGTTANTAGGTRSAGGGGGVPSAAGGSQAQTPASARSHEGGSGNGPHNRAAGGSRSGGARGGHGTGRQRRPAGHRPANHRPAGSHGSHRPANPHRSAPHGSSHSRGKPTHGTPAPGRGAPAGEAPRHGAAGGAGHMQTGSEAAGGPPTGRSSAARQATSRRPLSKFYDDPDILVESGRDRD